MVSLNELSRKAHINILVEDTNVLKEIIAKAERPCGIFIKIDVGSKRTGINPDNLCLINGLTNLLKNCRKVNFKGFLAHAGHTYHVKSPHAIQHIYDAAVKSLSALKTSYLPLFPDIITSWGDTPSCSILPKLTHFDEYRPGNFVYYDLMQYHLGSCDFDAIAVCVKVPIVATHPERLEIVLHGGAIHLSKEYIIIDAEKVYGELVLLRDGRAWQRLPERAYLTSLSQEHGIAKVPAGFFAQIKTGGIIGIVPVHSCLTVHQMLNLY